MTSLIVPLPARGKSSTPPLIVTRPFDGKDIADVETVSVARMNDVFDAAQARYRDRASWLPAHERARILRDVSRILANSDGTLARLGERLANEATDEGSKPIADSRAEVLRAAETLQGCADVLRTWGGREIPMDLNETGEGHLAFTRREPIGVVLAFSAFNHPVNLVAHQVGAAIAAGCPIVLKPAEATPLSALMLTKRIHEAGLPRDLLQVVCVSDLSVAEAMVRDPRVDYFSFIGSADVGWRLRSLVAPGTRCAFEHGGAAPVIVCEDADLSPALDGLAKAAFYHAGQVCVSVQNIFCHASRIKELVQGVVARANKMKFGNPFKNSTRVGPMIRPRDHQRVMTWIDDAVQAGATRRCGERAVPETCIAPTVLEWPAPPSERLFSELFGPVVNVVPFDDLNDAFRWADMGPYAFQTSVFTASTNTAMRAVHELDAATVLVNQHTAFRVDWMPFAGRRQSGLGTGGMRYAMEEMSHEKLVVLATQNHRH